MQIGNRNAEIDAVTMGSNRDRTQSTFLQLQKATVDDVTSWDMLWYGMTWLSGAQALNDKLSTFSRLII